MRGSVRVLAAVALVVTATAVVGWWIMIRMPGKSHRGPLPALTETQADLRDALSKDVEMLAGTIGERNVFRYDKLVEAAQYVERSLADAGYEVRRQEFMVDGKTCVNLSAEIKGRESPDEIVVWQPGRVAGSQPPHQIASLGDSLATTWEECPWPEWATSILRRCEPR